MNKKNLLLLYDRPQETVSITQQGDIVFEDPNDITSPNSPKHMFVSANLEIDYNKFKTKKIVIPEEIQELSRDENFSLFIPKHRRIAGCLIDFFLCSDNVDQLMAKAVRARNSVNPYLFNYAWSVAILHRSDTQDIDIPALIQSFPDKYIDPKIFARARKEARIVSMNRRATTEIPTDFTASDLEEEHRLAYFREDLGINLHHWHWHLVYPVEAAREIVAKNRRGELFYYMHQQIVARYNFERLSNKLKRTTRFNDFKEEIPEAYFPKLDSSVASRSWPARVSNQKLHDLDREVDQITQDVDDLKRWSDRIFNAIAQGSVTNKNGDKIVLSETEGIDILGNIIESSILSPNRAFYGDLHNMGHLFIAYIHDPDNRHLESFGVMGDTATAMRDPIFYRWHSYIDDIFQEYKETLPRYSENQLNYPGVYASKIELHNEQGGPKNTINTFWQQSKVDMSRGMDFQPQGPVFVRFTHLQHQLFFYKIIVNNTGCSKRGTCRIFLSPKFDERGKPWLFRDQRLMFIELDKFAVNLKLGENEIIRDSTESSVTISFKRTFRNLDLNRPHGGEELKQFNFCGCGWPHHMLVPKGTPEGLPCQLFAMISNYEDDVVNQTSEVAHKERSFSNRPQGNGAREHCNFCVCGWPQPNLAQKEHIEGFFCQLCDKMRKHQDDTVNQSTKEACKDAGSYCGVKDKLYPDKRSMGYPFDRMPRNGVETLKEFLTSNMCVEDVSVKFSDRESVRPRQQN